MSLKHKIALVTGAAQGLGKAFSNQLLKSGASVCLVDMREEDGQKTMEEFQRGYAKDRVAFLKGDVRHQEEMEGVFQSAKERFGGLDIVINNAGVGGESALLWERTIDVNVHGTIRCTILAMDHLRKDKGGKGGVIVNVSSMAGINPNPCSPAYCASKSAIIQYSLCWAKNPELAANGVRVNVLAPAFVDTPLMAGITQEDNCMLPGVADMIIQKAGIMTAESVAEATMELIEAEHNKNGQVLKMMQNGGKIYHDVQ